MKIAAYFLTFAFLCSALILTGCEEKTKIEMSPEKGVEVQTPGSKTEVNIGGGQGIQVETPKTKVDIGGGQGIQVTPKDDVPDK